MTTMPQRESTIAVPDDRRKQLGAFLRARRESLDPQRLGLPRVGRRRTPGLRREEVAMLADVGVTWSTCRWTRRASRRWRGWTNINHKESDGWQCAIFGYCPAGAAGRFPLPPGVGWKAKPCREIFYVICGFNAHCAPG